MSLEFDPLEAMQTDKVVLDQFNKEYERCHGTLKYFTIE